MANLEYLARLRQGVEAWNKWRQANPCIAPNLRKVDLRRANLTGTDLTWVDLSGADLGGANLTGADLSGADLSRANLDGADLSGANLGGTDFRRANFRRADLGRVILIGADLSDADLSDADLSGANLSGANLHKADLSGADLSGADLSGADLSRAILGGTILGKTNLSKVSLQQTIFSDINLAEVEGLDTCHHDGPSILALRTLQQSGPLPLAFLRGCGLPDLLIDYYLPLLPNQPIQYDSYFISYSSKDEEFAQRLHADLQNNGVRCWFAPEDIKGGRKLHEQIDEAIRLHEKLLLVLSEHSMNSEWVKTEIAKARQREVREKRQVLFPIRLVDYKTIQQWECFDGDTGKDSAREIREYFIPDFSNWKSHDAYQQSFDRLLRSLKPALERKPETS